MRERALTPALHEQPQDPDPQIGSELAGLEKTNRKKSQYERTRGIVGESTYQAGQGVTPRDFESTSTQAHTDNK